MIDHPNGSMRLTPEKSVNRIISRISRLEFFLATMLRSMRLPNFSDSDHLFLSAETINIESFIIHEGAKVVDLYYINYIYFS